MINFHSNDYRQQLQLIPLQQSQNHTRHTIKLRNLWCQGSILCIFLKSRKNLTSNQYKYQQVWFDKLEYIIKTEATKWQHTAEWCMQTQKDILDITNQHYFQSTIKYAVYKVIHVLSFATVFHNVHLDIIKNNRQHP